MYSNVIKLAEIAARDLKSSNERNMIESYEAKVRAMKGSSKSGSYLPLEIARRKYGVINVSTQVETKKYHSIKEGDSEWQAAYLVRDKLTEEPRLYGEVLKYDKDTKTNKANRKDIAKLSLKQLPFFSNIQSMFDNIKEIHREESMVAFKTDGDKIPEDIEEYQFNDGFSVYEPVTYITYRANFGSRDIVYTSNDKTERIFNVMTYESFELAYKARNKWLNDINSMRNINDRYDIAAISKADREYCISKGVYGEQSLYMY